MWAPAFDQRPISVKWGGAYLVIVSGIRAIPDPHNDWQASGSFAFPEMQHGTPGIETFNGDHISGEDGMPGVNSDFYSLVPGNPDVSVSPKPYVLTKADLTKFIQAPNGGIKVPSFGLSVIERRAVGAPIQVFSTCALFVRLSGDFAKPFKIDVTVDTTGSENIGGQFLTEVLFYPGQLFRVTSDTETRVAISTNDDHYQPNIALATTMETDAQVFSVVEAETLLYKRTISVDPKEKTITIDGVPSP